MTIPSDQIFLDFSATSEMLAGRTILITGAAAGIGAALAESCAALGATTVLVDKNQPGLEQLYDQIESKSHTLPILHPLDLEGASPDDYEELATNIEQQIGQLDGLVLNAGWLGAYTPFAQHDAKLYHQTMMANLHGHFFLTQACLPALEKSDHASIIFSTHASNKAYSGAFGIAKAGFTAMMSILSDEYDSERFIRVNGVDTGPVNTAMRRLNYPGEDPSQHPLPTDVLNPYLYFLSPECDKLTGYNFVRNK